MFAVFSDIIWPLSTVPLEVYRLWRILEREFHFNPIRVKDSEYGIFFFDPLDKFKTYSLELCYSNKNVQTKIWSTGLWPK